MRWVSPLSSMQDIQSRAMEHIVNNHIQFLYSLLTAWISGKQCSCRYLTYPECDLNFCATELHCFPDVIKNTSETHGCGFTCSLACTLLSQKYVYSKMFYRKSVWSTHWSFYKVKFTVPTIFTSKHCCRVHLLKSTFVDTVTKLPNSWLPSELRHSTITFYNLFL